MPYAENTKVPLKRSLSEISSMLRKAGAEQIAQMEDRQRFAIQFFMESRMIRFTIPMPMLEDMPERDGRGSRLSPASRLAKRDQSARQRGRALMLVIKAKLESIESEVETFEQAFLANVVMADGRTLYERVHEPIALEYQSGKVEPLKLTGPSE